MATKTCRTKGCNAPAHARGLCQRCYDQARKGSRRAKRKREGLCKAKGCRNVQHSNGFCKSHAGKATGASSERDGQAQMKQLECSVSGCTNAHHAKGLCKVHYSQQRRRRRSSRSAAAPEPVLVPEQVAAEPAVAVAKPSRSEAAAESRAAGSRLEELRRRYERMKREIARIAETFDTEVDAEVEEE